jgi:aspartyl/asparaginyl beta-hydroxylase (cupin superfamily)
MANTITQLVQAANEAATAGNFQLAERHWNEVRRLEPRHPKALFSLGFHALQRGDVRGALELLRAAREVAPTDLILLLTLAAAFRQRNDAEGEYEAIQTTLTVDAYFLPGLLAKASWIERNASRTAAARMYKNALKVAPPPTHWPANLKPHLEHAQRVVERDRGECGAFLEQNLADTQARLPPDVAGRWREATSIMAGRSQPYHQDCNQLHVPRLPEVPFHERSAFPWLSAIEAKTDVIRAELLAALKSDRDRFSPYITYNPGDPVNQWQELNHSLRWSVLKLWASGEPEPANIERCPETAQAIAALPLVDIEGLCPNAMFSALAPKTRIPPHHGETNARLVAHLPLIVPERCLMRVGYETREWKVGEVLILDDTIEHEAINDSDELRVVLIFDLWNPHLAPEEREMVRAMTAAARAYTG